MSEEHAMSEEHGQRTFEEQLRVGGEQVVDVARRLVREGNARRIVIHREGEERSLVELPVTVGVVGAAIAPLAAAIGTAAAVATGYTITVERVAPPDEPEE